MNVVVTPWSEALQSGVTAQRWAKTAMMETHNTHPSLQLILLRQALSSDPETRKWIHERDHNRWTAETLLKDFIAKFCSSIEPETPQIQSSAPWTELPSEPLDLASCALVCRTFRVASNDDALWRGLHVRAWGDLPVAPRSSWRRQFSKSCFPSEGNINSIRVRLDRDVVWSGQATPLTGEVYLRLIKPVLCTGVLVTLFGFEKVLSAGMHSSNSGHHYGPRARTHSYFHEQKRYLCPDDDTDYLNPKPKPVTLAAGLYIVPFSFLVPGYGIHGRALQRTFTHVSPVIQIAYGVTATLEAHYTSKLDSIMSVFSASELSSTAQFYVDRFYDRSLLRITEPVSVTKQMTFMFGGPISACLVVDCPVAVVGGTPFSLRLQVDNQSNYYVKGAAVVLSSYIRTRAVEEKMSKTETFTVSESLTVPKEVAQLQCPFIQVPPGVSTAWNWHYPVPAEFGPSIQHATYFEFAYMLTVKLHVSYTLSSLAISIPVVLLGPNFA